MCDFSAAAAKQRAAAKDDSLITAAIGSHTRGFVDLKHQDTAVCLLPGTQLAFAQPVKKLVLDGAMGQREVQLTHTMAKFVQVDTHNELTHHDALEFPDGSTVKLTLLAFGQRAAVIQLPAPPKTERERQEQRRAAYV